MEKKIGGVLKHLLLLALELFVWLRRIPTQFFI